jgi:hypothetical protein
LKEVCLRVKDCVALSPDKNFSVRPSVPSLTEQYSPGALGQTERARRVTHSPGSP